MLEKLLEDIDIVEVIGQFVSEGVCPFCGAKPEMFNSMPVAGFCVIPKPEYPYAHFSCPRCERYGTIVDFIIYYNRKKEDLDKPPTWQEYIDACEYLMEYSKA